MLLPLLPRTYQKQIAGSLPSRRGSYNKSPMTVLLFLAETGALYCCTLVSIIAPFSPYEGENTDR